MPQMGRGEAFFGVKSAHGVTIEGHDRCNHHPHDRLHLRGAARRRKPRPLAALRVQVALSMKDPILTKLKTDALIVWKEFCRALIHRPERQEWQHPRVNPPAPKMPMVDAQTTIRQSSGLCYFHLN